MVLRLITFFLLLFFLFLPSLSATTKTKSIEPEIYSTRNLTDTLCLFGVKIDLRRDDIRERFEREFFQLLEKRGLMYILTKRYAKYKRLIEAEIKKLGVHPDLIYLVIAESKLNPRALSRAQAGGLWQFIKETGKKEGLIVNDVIDERYDIVKSTRIALLYLQRLKEEFKDWFLAASAYNAGEKRVRDAIQNQNFRDFFDLYLPEETERYIFRILAIKEIIENKEKYGIRFDQEEMYGEVSVDSITINVEKELHTASLAQWMELPYRQFRYLNLHLRRYVLPKGKYTIYFPREKRAIFLKNLKSNQSLTFEE